MSARFAGALSGLVVAGDGRGRALGFPTANLACDPALLPADGIYAAWVQIDDELVTYPASVSVGANPTFEGRRERRVEVHLHDVDLDLYGRLLHVEIVELLRGTVRFADTAALIAQSHRDVSACSEVLRRIAAANG